MGWTDFFRKARLPDRSPSAEPPAGFRWLIGTRTATVPVVRVAEAAQAVRHPIAFRCMNKIAEAVQSASWTCIPDPTIAASSRAGAAAIADVNALLTNPHDTLTPDQFRYWLALVFANFNRASFVVGVSEGKANALYPLDSRLLVATRNDRGGITSYTYGSENGTTYPTRRRAAAGASYLCEIVRPNLAGSTDDADRPTPLGAVGMPLSISSLLLTRAHDTAAGTPNVKYLISADKNLTSHQLQSIKDHIDDARPGSAESGNVLLIDGATVTVTKLDDGLADLHSKIPLDDMARMIAGAWGVPIPLLGLGAADSAKYAGNYQEARRAFWEETVIPGYLVPIENGLTAALCPPGAKIEFDRDSIEALADARIARAKNLETVGFLTVDEKRDLAGYGPVTEQQRAELSANKPAATAPADPTNGA